MVYTRQERNEYMSQYREDRRAWARNALGNQCAKCPSTDDLEFDHIVPELKLKAIASMLTQSWEMFTAEVAKCQLLCREHHLAKSRQVYDRQLKLYEHGTQAAYLKAKCRCDRCRVRQAERRAKWRKGDG